MKIKFIAASAVALIISGCTLAPKYEKPVMAVPDTWGKGMMYDNLSAYDSAALELTSFIKDGRLLAIIKMAIDSNRDLRARISDVEAARALYRVQRSNLLPSIGISAGGSEAKNVTGSQTGMYSADIGVSAFELDLFGKNRSMSSAAFESYLASESAAQSAKITMIAETANAWMTLAADRELLSLANETVASAVKSEAIAKRRFNDGLTSELDMYQAQTVLKLAEADVANYTAIIAQDINAIELLAGGPVDEALLPLGFESDTDWLGNIPVGVSSVALLNRPDIAQAEHTLKGANADIGAARAAFFPSISLFSSAGLASSALTGLFTGGISTIWDYGLNITMPIFTAGKNIANLDYAKAKYNTALAQYDGAIQTAFRDVKDALARRSTIYDQMEKQRQLADISKKEFTLAEMRYTKGVDTYLNVLQAQRYGYDYEKQLINITLTELTNRISLYRVLGGGSEKIIVKTEK